MLRTIATKVLRDSWRGLLFWNLGIAALAFLTVGSYPAIRDNPELNQFMASRLAGVLGGAVLVGRVLGALAGAVGASAGARGVSIGIAAAVGIAAYLVQSL